MYSNRTVGYNPWSDNGYSVAGVQLNVAAGQDASRQAAASYALLSALAERKQSLRADRKSRRLFWARSRSTVTKPA